MNLTELKMVELFFFNHIQSIQLIHSSLMFVLTLIHFFACVLPKYRNVPHQRESAPCWFRCYGLPPPQKKNNQTNNINKVIVIWMYCVRVKEKQSKDLKKKKNDPFNFHFLNIKMLWHFIFFWHL